MSVEVTANKIRIRMRNPNLFKEGSFRTKKLAGEKGIQIVIGKLKSSKKDSQVVQTYLFDKKSWTEEQVQKWMKTHVRKHMFWEDTNFISKKDALITKFEDKMLKIEEITEDNIEFLIDDELITLRNRFKQVYVSGFNKKIDTVMFEVRKRNLPCWNTWLEKEMKKKRIEKEEQPLFKKSRNYEFTEEIKKNLQSIAERKIRLLKEETEQEVEDWAYLIHHVHVDSETGEEELHHCFVLDHLGNKYKIDHIEDKDGEFRHCLVGLEDDQEVFWSDEEAEAAGEEIPCANRQLES